MKRFLATILAAFFACCTAYAGPLQYLHGQTGRYGETGGGGTEIVGQTEVIATYAEAIATGAPVIIRDTRRWDFAAGEGMLTEFKKANAMTGGALAGKTWAVAISPDNKLLSTLSYTSPGLVNYLIEYNSELATHTFNRLNEVIGGQPAGGAPYIGGIAYSPDSKILSVAHESSPFITSYLVDYDTELATYTFTKMGAVIGGNPSARGTCVAYSPNGEILSVGDGANPGKVTNYRVVYDSEAESYTFTKIGALTLNYPNSLAYSLNGDILSVGYTGSPYLINYRVEYDDGAGTYTFSEANALTGGAAAGVVNGVTYSPNGEIISVAHTTSPYVTNYRIEYDTELATYTFTKMKPVNTNPEGIGRGVAFSPDGKILSVVHEGWRNLSNYFVTYDSGLATYTFTKIDNALYVQPGGIGRGVAFSPDGEILSVAHEGTPYLTNYRNLWLTEVITGPHAFNADTADFSNSLLLNLTKSFGYAMEGGVASEAKTIIKIFDLR